MASYRSSGAIKLAPNYMVFSDDPCETLVCSAQVLVACAFESDNQSERWSNENLKHLTETRDESLWGTEVGWPTFETRPLQQ